jgi:beta-lactamase class A
MRQLAAIALLLLVPVLYISQATPVKSGLTRLLEGELSRFPAKAGIYVKHMTTGEEAGVRADVQFNSASVIKIPVMIIAFQMADQKKLSLDERVTLKKSDYRGGSGVLRMADVGLSLTIRDIITEMIITSDNTATDFMIAKVGGVDRVNQWLKENGYTQLKLMQTANDLFRKNYELIDPKYKSLTSEDVFALQIKLPAFTEGRTALLEEVQKASTARDFSAEFFKKMETDQSFWLGAMSPHDTERLLETISKGAAASKQACDEMQRIMRGQQSGARRLPHYLNVGIGHKTGDYPPAVANDVGIIYAHSGPIAIAVFVQNITGPYAESEDHIGIVARMIVDYFDGATISPN